MGMIFQTGAFVKNRHVAGRLADGGVDDLFGRLIKIILQCVVETQKFRPKNVIEKILGARTISAVRCCR